MKALTPFRLKKCKVTEVPSASQIKVSPDDATAIKAYCDNFDSPIITIAIESVLNTGSASYKTPYYEEFKVSSIDTAGGTITVDGNLNGYGEYDTEKTYVIVNKVVDGMQEEYLAKNVEAVGNALSLDGSTQYAYHADDDTLDMGKDDFMLSFFFNIHTIGSRLISKGYPVSGVYSDSPLCAGYEWRTHSSYGDAIRVAIGDTSDNNAMHDVPITLNKPTYLVTLFDKENKCYVFKDGIYNNASFNILAVSGEILNGQQFRISDDAIDADVYSGRIFRFGQSGLTVTGTGGNDLEIRVGSSTTGDIIYSEKSPYSPSHPGGLIPAMYRNPGASLSELGYGSLENAERSEKVTDGGLEQWASSTDLTNWSEQYTSSGVRDITQESTTVNSGTYSAKFKATGNDGTMFRVYRNNAVDSGSYYELVVYTYYKTQSSGASAIIKVQNRKSDYKITTTYSKTISSEIGWTKHNIVFKTDDNTKYVAVNLELHNSVDDEIYFDDISLKRIGEVAHWQMDESGTPSTLTDSTDNHLDLTTVGSPSMTKAAISAWRATNMIIYKDMQESVQGTQSLYAQATDDDAMAEYIFHLPQGTDAKMALWYKIRGSGSCANITCDDTDGNVFYENTNIQTTDWKRVDFVISSNSVKPAISLRFYGITKDTEIWVDAVTGVGSIVKNGAFEYGTDHWEGVGGATVAQDADAYSGYHALKITGADDGDNDYVVSYADGVAGQQYVLSLAGKVADSGKKGYVEVVNVGEELLLNNDFENWDSSTDCVYWVKGNTSSSIRDITQESSIVHSGSYSVKMKATGNDGTVFYFAKYTIPIVKDKWYEYSIWTYYKTQSSGNLMLEFQFRDSSDVIVCMKSINITSAETRWTKHAFIAKSCVTSNKGVFVIFLNGADNDEVYIDLASFKEINQITPPAILTLDGTDYAHKSIIVPAKLGSFRLKAYHDSGTSFYIDDVSMEPLESVAPTEEEPSSYEDMLTGNGLLIRGDRLYYDVDELYLNDIFILKYKPLYSSDDYGAKGVLLYIKDFLTVSVTGSTFTAVITIADGSTKTLSITKSYSRLDRIELRIELAYGTNKDEAKFSVYVNNVVSTATATGWTRAHGSDKLYIMSEDDAEYAIPAYLNALLVGNQNYVRAVDTTAPDISDITPFASGYHTKISLNFYDSINSVGAQYRLWRGPIAYANIVSVGSGSKLYLQSSREDKSGNKFKPGFQEGKLINLYVYQPDTGAVAIITGNGVDGTGEYITYSNNTSSFAAGKDVWIGGMKVAMVKEIIGDNKILISNNATSSTLSFYRFNAGDYIVIKNKAGEVIMGPCTIAELSSDVLTVNANTSAVHAGDTILFYHNTLNRVCAENIISLPSTKEVGDKIYYTDMLSSILGTVSDRIQNIDQSLRSTDTEERALVYWLRTAYDDSKKYSTDVYRIGYCIQAMDRYGNASPGTTPVVIDPNKPYIYSDSRADNDVFTDSSIAITGINTDWVQEIE